MTVLGGSLLQVLIPLICAGAFLGRHLNPFGAAVCVWWTGQSLIGLAPYINDARAQRLVLLGGVTGRDRPGYHDWNNILGQLGWLRHDHTLARLVQMWGTVLILLALAWAAYLVHARAQRLVLLGGVTGRDRPGYHDWNNILGQLGWLRHDHTLARLVQMWGTVLILLALAWAAYLVHAQYKIHIRSGG